MLCEVCGPKNDCTCGGCQCRWCRDRRGESVTPLERRQMDRWPLSVLAADVAAGAQSKEQS